MLDRMLSEVYGYLPPKPLEIRFEVNGNCIPNFCAGKAVCHQVTAVCTLESGTFSFPFTAVLPTDGEKHPFFVHINFRPDVTDRNQPTEELVDNGFAVLTLCYNAVTRDDGDFTNGLAGLLYPGGVREKDTGPGKIALWAWAAHRLLDYAETVPETPGSFRKDGCFCQMPLTIFLYWCRILLSLQQ